MNIFTISDSPIECAECLDDVRLRKMILETAQILSTVMRKNKIGLYEHVYKQTHSNHPVVLWAEQNTRWTFRLFASLCDEYLYRFDKEHKSDMDLMCAFMPAFIETQPAGEFCNCTPYKDIHVFDAYKKHLSEKWNNSTPKWTRRTPPAWYIKG